MLFIFCVVYTLYIVVYISMLYIICSFVVCALYIVVYISMLYIICSFVVCVYSLFILLHVCSFF